jgi:hypothetical protein
MDYTRALKKIVPDPGGEGVVRMRKAVVVAANSTTSTVTINLSGEEVTDVPVLNAARIAVGSSVQVISYPGGLLVLGSGGNPTGAEPRGLWARSAADTNSVAIGTTLSSVLTTPARTYLPGRAYEIRSYSGITTATSGSSTALFQAFRVGPDTLLADFHQWPIAVSNRIHRVQLQGCYFSIGASALSVSVTLKMAHATNAVTMIGTAASPRRLEIWDVGAVSDFALVPVW